MKVFLHERQNTNLFKPRGKSECFSKYMEGIKKVFLNYIMKKFGCKQ